MNYVLRIKAVSSCLGIRRASLCFYKYQKNMKIDITKEEHPLNTFKSILINDLDVTILDKTNKICVGSDTYFYNNRMVESLTNNVLEQITLGIMLLPLDEKMLPFYEDAIKKDYMFDQWKGEFEFHLGMMYELDMLDNEKAKEWYTKALEKGFKFKLR